MKISREVKIGVVSVVALVLLYWGINYLKGKDILDRQKELYAVYDKVDGLVEGNPVQISGLKVGIVKNLKLKGSTGKIVVKFVVQRGIEIPANSIARIYSFDLIGSKAIEILQGDSIVMAKEGDTLKSEIQVSLKDQVSLQMLPFKKKAESLMLSMDSVLSVIQYIFNENTRKNLEASFESIRFAIKNIEHTSYNIDTLVSSERGRLSRIISNVESISLNIKNNNDNLTNIISNFSTISDSLARTDFLQTIHSTNETLKNLSAIVSKINKGEGSMGLLINNDTMYRQLESSSHNLNLLLEDMRLNPHRYVRFSIFGGGKSKYKDPEK